MVEPFTLILRLPKTIVNQEICCRLVIALRISPGGFTLSSFVPFAFGLPSPIHLLVRRGPCTLVPYFPLWVQCAGFQVEMTMGRCHGHLLYLHFTHNHLLIACIADNWHLPSIWTNKVHMESMTRRTGLSQFLITSACRVKGEKCVTEPTLTSPLRKRGEAPLFRVKMRPQCISSPILAILRVWCSANIILSSHYDFCTVFFRDCSRMFNDRMFLLPTPKPPSLLCCAGVQFCRDSIRASVNDRIKIWENKRLWRIVSFFFCTVTEASLQIKKSTVLLI